MKKKLGRPKENKKPDDSVFVGMKMPKDVAEAVSKDAAKHFRMRTQHILWILSEHINKTNAKIHNVPKEKPINQPIYTEQEMNEMYKAKERGEL